MNSTIQFLHSVPELKSALTHCCGRSILNSASCIMVSSCNRFFCTPCLSLLCHQGLASCSENADTMNALFGVELVSWCIAKKVVKRAQRQNQFIHLNVTIT